MKGNRKDFEKLAKIIKENIIHGDARSLAKHIANLLKRSNGAFDKDKFLTQCGVQRCESKQASEANDGFSEPYATGNCALGTSCCR